MSVVGRDGWGGQEIWLGSTLLSCLEDSSPPSWKGRGQLSFLSTLAPRPQNGSSHRQSLSETWYSWLSWRRSLQMSPVFAPPRAPSACSARAPSLGLWALLPPQCLGLLETQVFYDQVFWTGSAFFRLCLSWAGMTSDKSPLTPQILHLPNVNNDPSPPAGKSQGCPKVNDHLLKAVLRDKCHFCRAVRTLVSFTEAVRGKQCWL